MAIAFDSSSQLGQNGSVTATWEHTCAGDDRILIVGAEIGTGKTAVSATYDGQAMTLINSQSTGWAVFDNMYLWYIVAPATGANNIVVTASASTFLYCAAGSYTGVDQASPINVEDENAVDNTVSTGTLTTNVDNTWLVGFCGRGSGADVTWAAGANTTEREEHPAGGFYSFIDTNAAQTPAGEHSITTTMSAQREVAMHFAALAPTGGGGGGTPRVKVECTGSC